METKKIQKIQGASLLLSLEKEKGVELVHHLKLTHFTVLVYLRYCLITTKVRVQALVPVVVR